MNEILANVNNYNNLISFQENSIVSKILIKNKSGNITLFAFWQDQELSEHTSPFDALVVCLDGEGFVSIDGVQHSIYNGDLILLPANHPHSVRAKSNLKILLVMIKEPL